MGYNDNFVTTRAERQRLKTENKRFPLRPGRNRNWQTCGEHSPIQKEE